MAKIRKIYDQTIKPDGTKTTIYPITSTRAVYTPEGETLDSYIKDGYFHGADLAGYKVVYELSELPLTETSFGYLMDSNLYVWVGTNGDTLGGKYQNCGPFRGPKGEDGDNAPDEEDLTAVDGILKFANRSNLSGLGYFILRRDKTFADQVTLANTVYEIRYDFNLNGASITIPEGCMLKFNGGSLHNGELVGNNTGIECGKHEILRNIVISGTWDVPTSYPEWFGGDIQKAITISDVIECSGNYNYQNSDYDDLKTLTENRQDFIDGEIEDKSIIISSQKTIIISGSIKQMSPLNPLFVVTGNGVIFTGGGEIIGCGIVNDANSSNTTRQWDSSFISIQGSGCKINNLTFRQPTSECIYVHAHCRNTSITGSVFGGGLEVHGEGTVLFGIWNLGWNTLIKNCRFVPLDGKALYTALFAAEPDPTKARGEIPFSFENNYVESTLEHAVYSYQVNGIIHSNTLKNVKRNTIQCFVGNQTISNNNISFDENPGIAIFVNGSNFLIEGNTIRNAETGIQFTSAYGSETTTGCHSIVRNNMITTCDSGERKGIFVFLGPDSGICEDLQILNNTIHNISVDTSTFLNYGFWLSLNKSSIESIFVRDITISGNNFYNLGGSGINISSSATGGANISRINIVDNTFKDVCRNTNGTNYGAIRLYATEGAYIRGNTVRYTEENETYAAIGRGYFVKFEAGCSRPVIEDNYFNNIYTSNGLHYNTLLLGSVTYPTIKNNFFSGVQSAAVTLTSGTSSVEIRPAAVSYNNSTPTASAILLPINNSAITQQAGSSPVKVQLTTGRIRLYTSDSSNVQSDCKYYVELVYA